MKRILLFVLPILMVAAAVFTIFGIFQVRTTEKKMMDDLRRKARAVAEGMELAVRDALVAQNIKNATYLVEKFGSRERLQGCAIYDSKGTILALTKRFSDWKERDHTLVATALLQKTPAGGLEKFKEYSVYVYGLPVLDENGTALGLIEIIYDTSYVFTQLTELWRSVSAALIILVTLILLISFLAQRRLFAMPVLQLTDWFRRFQKGEIDHKHPIREKGELGKLASEVEQVALNLRVARRTISDAASGRIDKHELWTEGKLRDLIHARLGENALYVVSNREPFMHVPDEKTGKPICVRPASGVVSAIDPILRACGGTWIAHGSGEADRQFVNSKDKLGVPPKDIRYILKRVWLTKEEEEGYYYGFSNEGLWPLCHITHTRPIFRQTDWETYKKVNQRFADSILEELPAKNAFVFIQDYHFTLLPKMIKEKRPDATIAMFWHIPWPNPEVFSICPYQEEILDGMLACELIGFHVQNHCNNFMDTANRLLESRVDTERFSIVRANKETLVRAFPISVNGRADIDERTLQFRMKEIRKEFGLEGKFVALGVDRLDYTKGITERVLAIDRFIEKYPQYKNKFVFIQLAAPSRTHIKRYRDLMGEIDDIIERKNWKYVDGSWRPIIYLRRHFSPEDIEPFYRLSDMCIVSSLHDGMNLVAKEYVSAKKDASGILLLSRFTGASRELTDAVQINPYSIEDFADYIRYAIEMPAEEKKRRMEALRRQIGEYNIYRWAASIVNELTTLKKI